MNRRLLALVPVVLAGAVALMPGTASANNPAPTANCDGLTFVMPSGVAGTVITTTLNGRQVDVRTVARQFDATSFTIPSPDLSVAQVWTVTVDAPWDIPDESFRFPIAPCVAATTIPPATTTTTTAPAPSTTVPAATTTTVAVASTVITTPRPQPSTTLPTSSTSFPPTLPATGAATDLLLFVGAFVAGVGIAAHTIARRPR